MSIFLEYLTNSLLNEDNELNYLSQKDQDSLLQLANLEDEVFKDIPEEEYKFYKTMFNIEYQYALDRDLFQPGRLFRSFKTRPLIKHLLKYLISNECELKNPLSLIKLIINFDDEVLNWLELALEHYSGEYSDLYNPNIAAKIAKYAFENYKKLDFNLAKEPDKLIHAINRYNILRKVDSQDFKANIQNKFPEEYAMLLPTKELKKNYLARKDDFFNRIRDDEKLKEIFSYFSSQQDKRLLATLISLDEVELYELKGLSIETIKNLLNTKKEIRSYLLKTNNKSKKPFLDKLSYEDYELFFSNETFRTDFLEHIFSLKEAEDAKTKSADAEAKRKEREELKRRKDNIKNLLSKGAEKFQNDRSKEYKSLEKDNSKFKKIKSLDSQYPGFKDYYYSLEDYLRQRFDSLPDNLQNMLMDNFHNRINDAHTDTFKSLLSLSKGDLSLFLRLDEDTRSLFMKKLNFLEQTQLLNCFRDTLKLKEIDSKSNVDCVRRFLELRNSNSENAKNNAAAYSELSLKHKIKLEKFILDNYKNMNWMLDAERFLNIPEEERDNFTISSTTNVHNYKTKDNFSKDNDKKVFLEKASKYIHSIKKSQEILEYFKEKGIEADTVEELLVSLLERTENSLDPVYTLPFFNSFIKHGTKSYIQLVLLTMFCINNDQRFFIIHLLDRDTELLDEIFSMSIKEINEALYNASQENLELITQTKKEIDDEKVTKLAPPENISDEIKEYNNKIEFIYNNISKEIKDHAIQNHKDSQSYLFLRQLNSLRDEFLKKTNIDLSNFSFQPENSKSKEENTKQYITALNEYILNNYFFTLSDEESKKIAESLDKDFSNTSIQDVCNSILIPHFYNLINAFSSEAFKILKSLEALTPEDIKNKIESDYTPYNHAIKSISDTTSLDYMKFPDETVEKTLSNIEDGISQYLDIHTIQSEIKKIETDSNLTVSQKQAKILPLINNIKSGLIQFNKLNTETQKYLQKVYNLLFFKLIHIIKSKLYKSFNYKFDSFIDFERAVKRLRPVNGFYQLPYKEIKKKFIEIIKNFDNDTRLKEKTFLSSFNSDINNHLKDFDTLLHNKDIEELSPDELNSTINAFNKVRLQVKDNINKISSKLKVLRRDEELAIEEFFDIIENAIEELKDQEIQNKSFDSYEEVYNLISKLSKIEEYDKYSKLLEELEKEINK